MKTLLKLIAYSLIIGLASCGEKMPPKLDKRQLAEIDSIVGSQQDSIWKLLDADCEKVYLGYYDAAKDSIISKRLEEIESINAQ